MEEPKPQDTVPTLGSPFDFNLTNAIWLASTSAVILTLAVLKMTGVIH